MEEKISLKKRRKIYQILAILAPLVISAGWLSEDWTQALLLIAGIIMGTTGHGMAAHYSKEAREPAPLASRDRSESELDLLQEITPPLLSGIEKGLNLGLDRPR